MHARMRESHVCHECTYACTYRKSHVPYACTYRKGHVLVLIVRRDVREIDGTESDGLTANLGGKRSEVGGRRYTFKKTRGLEMLS